jgi:hypothetical protein
MEKVREVEMLLEANTVGKLITPNPYQNLATVNQHPPVLHEWWMVSGYEKVFLGFQFPS